MGLSVFTPALLTIGGLCGLALFISALNFMSLQGVKSRMVTQRSQELFGAQLLSTLQTQLGQAAQVNREAIESLREDYRTHVVEIAEVKASHSATVRQFDQMMASYTRLHQILVVRLLNMAGAGKFNANEDDLIPTL